MASLFSALALCIIFLIIIDLSNSDADIHGKRNNRIRIIRPNGSPLHKKRLIYNTGGRQSLKTGNQKITIKPSGSLSANGRKKWNKQLVKKDIRFRKAGSGKINRPKVQKNTSKLKKFVNKKHNPKNNKSFPKRKPARILSRHKQSYKTGAKKRGQRRRKVGRKGNKLLKTKIKKFDQRKVSKAMNEVLIPGKDKVSIISKLPLTNTNVLPSGKVQLPQLHGKEMDNATTYSQVLSVEHDMKNVLSRNKTGFLNGKIQSPKSNSKEDNATNPTMLKIQPGVTDVPVTSRLDGTSASYEDAPGTTKSAEETYTSVPTHKPMPQVQHKIKNAMGPSNSYEDTRGNVKSLKKIKTHAAKLIPDKTTTRFYNTKTTELSNEIPTQKPKSDEHWLTDMMFGKERAKVLREKYMKILVGNVDNGNKETARAEIKTTTTKISSRKKYPNNFFGMSPEAEQKFYIKKQCTHYENKTCFQIAAPSKCYEEDWTGKCINGTRYLKYVDLKTYEEVTVLPMQVIRTPTPGDFHKLYVFNSGLLRICVVHRKWDGLIKDTCVYFHDVLRDIPQLSRKIIEVYYGYYAGNRNENEDTSRATDVIGDVLRGYGTCERIAEKLPFLRQYFKKYAKPCY